MTLLLTTREALPTRIGTDAQRHCLLRSSVTPTCSQGCPQPVKIHMCCWQFTLLQCGVWSHFALVTPRWGQLLQQKHAQSSWHSDKLVYYQSISIASRGGGDFLLV
jgi:hypothetical protein